MVLGKLSPRKIPPSPNSNANCKPKPDPNRGTIFLGGNFPDTIFKIFYCFCMFANKRFINTGAYISNSKRFYNAKTWAHYFYVRRKILLNFHICISVSPLKTGKTMPKYGECLMASSLISIK